MSYLNGLPEPILVHIFREFNANQLLELKLVSRQINRLIRKHIAYLDRPTIDQIDFQLKHSSKRGIKKRNKQFCIRLKKKNRQKSVLKEIQLEEEIELDENVLDFVHNNISQFRLTNSINFNGLNIDSNFIQPFLKSTTDLSSIKNVTFELCKFDLTSVEFLEFIKQTSCTNLTVEFCSYTECLINNELFTCINQLDCLQVQVQSPIECFSLNDSTLEKWCRQKVIPHQINLHNCSVDFTIDCILKAIQTLHEAANKTTSDISWNLGKCKGSIVDLLTRMQQQSLNRFMQYSLSIEYDHQSQIGVKMSLNTPNTNLVKSPLQALESLVHSFDTVKPLKRCELLFTLPNC